MQLDIQNLKSLLKEGVLNDQHSDYCSETETGGNSPESNCHICASKTSSDSSRSMPSLPDHVEEFDEDAPLASLVCLSKNSRKTKISQSDPHVVRANISSDIAQDSSRGLSNSCDDQQRVGRKRARVIISDDEVDDSDMMDGSKRTPHGSTLNNADMMNSSKGTPHRLSTNYMTPERGKRKELDS